jgi:proton-translocating NADH-quinone oxidoreductase chain L
MLYNYIILIFAPLMGFLINFSIIFFETIYSVKINSKFTSLMIVLTTFFSTTLSLKLFYLSSQYKLFDYWFNLKFSIWFYFDSTYLLQEYSKLKWGFLFDSLSITMFLVITFVSVLVQLYATEYMSHDLNRTRFTAYLGLFVFFMILLVSADNYIQMFIGWEGVGLVSYLLINFWYTRVEAARSALKAVGVNKFGDYAFVMALIFMFKYFNSVEFETIFSTANFKVLDQINFLGVNFPILSFISFFILIAAVGKSAQLGLHTWLPDAMEGPTPVSALIHAATMVTAGVYLLVRSSPLIEFSPKILALTAIIGATTALFGASTALFQNDLKKVIAYSTCSQLGYMVCACGLSAYSAAMFHLVTHAFFKALLFLCAGSVIHALSDEQDMRKMGGLIKILPFTYAMMTIGSLSLMGFPFLAGYFSKDLILEIAASTYTFVGIYCFIIGTIAAIFTALYSVRLTYLTFFTKTNAYKNIIINAHEAPLLMAVPLMILSVLSIIAGRVLKSIFIDSRGEANYKFWKSAIYINGNNYQNRFDLHELSVFTKNIPTIAVFIAVCVALFVYYFNNFSRKLTADFVLRNWDKSFNFFLIKKNLYSQINFLKIFKGKNGLFLYYFFNKKWYFDAIYNFYIVTRTYLLSYTLIFKALDRGFYNLVIAPKTFNSLLIVVRKIMEIQTGVLYSYVFLIILFVVVLLILLSILFN